MIPHGIEIQYEDDFVYVFNEKDELMYKGILDYCPYKDEAYRWNEKDGCYDLVDLPGYRMVGCG